MSGFDAQGNPFRCGMMPNTARFAEGQDRRLFRRCGCRSWPLPVQFAVGAAHAAHEARLHAVDPAPGSNRPPEPTDRSTQRRSTRTGCSVSAPRCTQHGSRRRYAVRRHADRGAGGKGCGYSYNAQEHPACIIGFSCSGVPVCPTRSAGPAYAFFFDHFALPRRTADRVGAAANRVQSQRDSDTAFSPSAQTSARSERGLVAPGLVPRRGSACRRS